MTVKQIPYEMAFSHQIYAGMDVNDSMNFVCMSDVGRYAAYDEVGQLISICDTELEADVLISFYWWEYLNGGDPRIGQLPVLTSTEQFQYIPETYKNGLVVSIVTNVRHHYQKRNGMWVYMTIDEVSRYSRELEEQFERETNDN